MFLTLDSFLQLYVNTIVPRESALLPIYGCLDRCLREGWGKNILLLQFISFEILWTVDERWRAVEVWDEGIYENGEFAFQIVLNNKNDQREIPLKPLVILSLSLWWNIILFKTLNQTKSSYISCINLVFYFLVQSDIYMKFSA